jgi:hypothetical protein
MYPPIGYVTEPAPKKPRVKKVLTDAEKDEAAVKRDINKLFFEGEQEGVGEYPEALGGQ